MYRADDLHYFSRQTCEYRITEAVTLVLLGLNWLLEEPTGGDTLFSLRFCLRFFQQSPGIHLSEGLT